MSGISETTSAGETACLATSDENLRNPCYCEENVWRLAYRRINCERKPQESARNNSQQILKEEYHVVFISNEAKCCPMFFQKAKEEDESGPCYWDYHVILVCTQRFEKKGIRAITGDSRHCVLDMDSRLPYFCSTDEYLDGSFQNLEFIDEEYREKLAPRFRVIKAELYLENFFSDRMHMYDNEMQRWQAPPPSYGCIMAGWDGNESKKSNLDDYMNMEKIERDARTEDGTNCNNDTMGEVLTLDEFQHRFGSC